MPRKLNSSAVESGIQSLELRYCPIIDTDRKKVVAYRTSTVVYSLDMGTLTQHDYTYAADYGNHTGERLSEWNISEVIRHLVRIQEEAKFPPQFITARCTASFADMENMFDIVRGQIEKGHLKDPGQLCLEFPQSMLYLAETNARKNILDMKFLGVKTMLSGCGSSDCPVSKLVEVPVDYVLLEPTTTALINDKARADILPKFIQYLRSMNLQVFAEEIEDDNQLKALEAMDCIGVTASELYAGSVDGTESNLTFDEVLLQRGGDD